MTRPYLLVSLFFFFLQNSYSQKIEKFYDFTWKETEAEKARFFSVSEKTDSGWHRKDYFLHNRSLQMEGLYADSACTIPSGYFHFYHANRLPESFGLNRNGKKQGLWLTYYSNGMTADSAFYDNGQILGIRLSWHRNGYLKDSANIDPDGGGVEVSWFDNGYPSSAGKYAPGYKKNGKWKYFHRNGNPSAFEIYDQGKLIDKQYFDEKGAPMDTANKDRAADFPGGAKAWLRFLDKHLFFPDQYKFTNGDQAALVISAVIDEEGNLSDAEVSTPFYPAFDKIALDAIRHSPKWLPAIEHNRKVRKEIRQPVIFSLPQ